MANKGAISHPTCFAGEEDYEQVEKGQPRGKAATEDGEEPGKLD